MPRMKPVIECKDLVRDFGTFRAVDRVSFEVPKAAIFGLLGPNGSGKTTTIRILCGVLEASAGKVSVLGHDLAQGSEIIKPHVGYMSQRFGMYADLTVRENLIFFGRIHGFHGKELICRVDAQITQLELAPYQTRLAGNLSGGWKQRLAFGCAQIHDPLLVFLDEPTAGIDPVARRELWDLIYECSNRGVTYVVTTHYMDEAERCTHIAYLHQSRMLVCAPTEEINANSDSFLDGAHLYELSIANSADFLPQLNAADGILHASMFGRHIHLLTSSDTQPTSIFSTLGLEIDQDQLRRIQPSLEDVFVHLSYAQQEKHSAERISTHKAFTSPNVPHPITNKSSAADPHPSEETPANPTALDLDSRRTGWFSGYYAVVAKEFAQIRRQPTTLFFMLFLPVLQTLLFGYAIQLNIRNIPLTVLDLDQSQESRRLVTAFENSNRFVVGEYKVRMADIEKSLRNGNARAALIIPADFSSKIAQQLSSQAQLLVDGSDFQVATAALNTTKLISGNFSMELAELDHNNSSANARNGMAVELRTRVLFNEGLSSSHFFIPGLIGIILQLVTLALTTFSIVRERENGTLEQIFVTPIGKSEFLAGKIMPYAVLGIAESIIVAAVMIGAFGVPIAGNLWLLSALTLLFIICSLAMGVLISTLAKSQLAAMQLAYSITLPSVLLSGFMYPRLEMPEIIRQASNALPATHYIEIVRGIVLKGANFSEVSSPALWLLGCTIVISALSLFRFRKQLA